MDHLCRPDLRMGRLRQADREKPRCRPLLPGALRSSHRHQHQSHPLDGRRPGDLPQPRTMTLTAPEFIRRFLQHELPDCLHKFRYYGLWAPAHRQHLHRLQKELRQQEPAGGDLEQAESLPTDRHDDREDPTPGERLHCPECCDGRLHWVARIPRGSRDPPHA